MLIHYSVKQIAGPQQQQLPFIQPALSNKGCMYVCLYAYWPFAMLQIPSRLIRQMLFLSSTKREIRHFYVVVVQLRLRSVQKSVMHV